MNPRGSTRLDNLILAMLVTAVVLIIFAPYYSESARDLVLKTFKMARLPSWWIYLSAGILLLLVWLMTSTF